MYELDNACAVGQVDTNLPRRIFTSCNKVVLTNHTPGLEIWLARGILAHHSLQGRNIRRNEVGEMMMCDEIEIAEMIRECSGVEVALVVLM